MQLKISPSIMVCRTHELIGYIHAFEKVGLDSIHFDVMDGHYVDNIMLGTNLFTDVKELTRLPIDIHLMTYAPEKFVNYFHPRKDDRVSFHPETTRQAFKLLQTIREKGCKAGIVLNPGTPINHIDELYEVIDFVTLMMVNPGFAGQKLVPNGLEKIRRVREKLDGYGLDIDVFVDGNTTPENARSMYKNGANGIVVGTSSIVRSLETFVVEYNAYYDYILQN